MELINYSTSIWSVIPALLALSLAIITRKVILSLSIGIVIGAIMLTAGDIFHSLVYLKDNVISLVYDISVQEINADNVNILLFLLLLGILTALFTLSGSNQAFANWAKKRIKNRRGAKLMTASLVFVTFIDDYFHSLAVGAIARPVTDKFKISRAKLAYILDSTAAPMCVLMPISSWGAYIITLIAGLLASYAINDYSPVGAFMRMSAMNYYAIFSIIMVFLVAYFSLDLGAMAKHEKMAMAKNDIADENIVITGRMRNLVIPIFVLILATVFMMIYTGNQALASEGKSFSLLGAFENTRVGISLVFGGVSALIALTLCLISGKQINLTDYFKAWLLGIKSMTGAILILLFAWTINNVVADMKTGEYLSTLVSGNFMVEFLPALLFILAAIMAFSTGTSWGTFGIMLPIAAAIAANAAPELLLPCLSAVMAGAVCGDHCSPISDTTILSSTGAKCGLMDHVTTQLPYAMLVALATIVGYITIGFTASILYGFIATTLVFALLIMVLKKKG